MPKQEIIRRIRLYRFPISLKEPFIISLGKLDYADNVVVVVETSGGIKGFGECSPFRTIHGETGDTCMLVGKILAGVLKGENALDIDRCSALMDAAIFGNTSIKSAFDIALHDIAAQQSGVPLYKFLGGNNDKEIATDFTVSLGDPKKMANDAMNIVKSGFTVIKVKLGGNADEDYRRVKMIREQVGYSIPVRIDANQGWSVEEAIPLLNRLKEFNIQHCEEPVSRKNFMSLPQISRDSPIPIMADESCFDEYDAERLILMKACSLINIKLGKSSGLLKAKKIIQLAEKYGILLQAGGFLESRLGFTAIAHLALCSKSIVHFDFDTALMFSEDPVQGGITYGNKGIISIPDVHGLGASIPETLLTFREKIFIE